MANLPNITIADVGIIAFWNAHDHRVNGASIDPTDCIPTFSTHTVYDNGIDGKIDPSAKGWGGSDRQINVRVKNDGWIVAWVDRTNTFFYPNKAAGDFGESGYKGYYDILWDWFKYTGNISNTQTTLSNMIGRLYSALSNSGEFTFAYADVGHYCYEFPNANVLTLTDLFAAYAPIQAKTGQIQHTTGTTLYHASIAGSGLSEGVWGYSILRFAGNDIITGGNPTNYGAANIIAENWMPDSLTDYPVYVYSYGDKYSHGSVLIIWK